jgi:RHS repeat-associated protein
MLDPEPSMKDKTIHYYHCDHLGTPIGLINESGELDWRVELDPWGNVVKEYNPKNLYQPVRFQGQQFDEETGLHYNRHRYYDPNLGRYITQDPIELRGGLNLSTYVFSNPTRFIDPRGLDNPGMGAYDADVQVCRDPAFNGNIPFVDHYWLKVDNQEVGMGTPAAGRNTGNQYDYLGSRVETVSHQGRSKGKLAECRPVIGANKSVVKEQTKLGQPLGHFLPPFNYCKTYVDGVLNAAGAKDPFDPPSNPLVDAFGGIEFIH